ncbi:MAG: hypothetical protein M0025_06905 [Elusimicrobia bacterium]|nr:hypothetical protein [Elusimicrobiota bacterium]
MDSKILAIHAAQLGLKPQGSDHNATLAAAIESREPRYWAAFPALLANAAAEGGLDLETVSRALPEGERKHLKLLVFASLGLYESLGLRFQWAKKLSAGYPSRMVSAFKDKLGGDELVDLGALRIAPRSFRESFRLCFRGAAAGRALEDSLSRIFTRRQAQLFFKRLRGERMTKTEREYFSRVVKKKTLALADDELHALARRVLERVRREEGPAAD